jgi:hypothetical protein
MRKSILDGLQHDAIEIQKFTNLPKVECFKLAVQIWKAESLNQIAIFLRQDGEFQESMSEIAKAINNEL